MSNQQQNPIKKLIDEGAQILKRFQDRLDWKNIDKHESLTFLNKNFHKKPSDIAKIFLYVLVFIIFYIQGFRTLTILMCYVLPIGIMILKICEAMRNKRKNSHEIKHKLKDSQFEEKISLQKNDSMLSISSKKKQNKFESTAEKSQLLEQEGKVQNTQISIRNPTETEKNNLSKTEDKKDQGMTINQVSSIFIFYFIVNLTIDLAEPLLLLFLQTLLNLGEVLVAFIEELIFYGNFWSLLYLPFRFISNFFIQTVNFSQVNSLSQVVFIMLRVIFSAFLLNLNLQQRNACTNLLFEQRIENLPFGLTTEEKQKNE